MGYCLGSLFLPYYGTWIVLGLIAAAALGVWQVKRFGPDVNDFILLAAAAGLGGMIGAKALYLLVSWRSIEPSRLSDPAYLNALMGGGFVFYGGLIGGGLGVLLCRRLAGGGSCLYVSIPCLPLAHAFGRLGCGAVGCCYGVPVTSGLSVIYLRSPFAPNGVPLFPVQFAEALGNFIIAAVLLVYIDVLRRRHGLLLYVLLYAPMRFMLEFFRCDDARGHLGPLSVSQWISLLLILAALLLRLPLRREKRRGG